MAAEHAGEALMEYARVPKLAGRSLREDGSSASESSCTSSESESEASTSESATTESSDHESPFEEEPGDAAIKLAAAGVQSGTASEVMPESGCAKRAGITGNLDAQSKPASEATSSGQYPRLRHMSRCFAGMHMGIPSHHCHAGPERETLYEKARLEQIAGNRAELARGLNPGGRLCLRLSAPAPARRGRPLKDATLDSSGIAAPAIVPARRSSRLTGPFAAPRGVCT